MCNEIYFVFINQLLKIQLKKNTFEVVIFPEKSLSNLKRAEHFYPGVKKIKYTPVIIPLAEHKLICY